MIKFCPFPYIFSLTNNLPTDVGGRATMFFVRIRPKYQDDEGILKHEETHIKLEWIITLILLVLVGAAGYFNHLIWLGSVFCPMVESILYKFYAPYRKWSEVRAYKRQLKYPPANLNVEHYRGQYAEFIATKYGLKKTVEEATKLLS